MKGFICHIKQFLTNFLLSAKTALFKKIRFPHTIQVMSQIMEQKMCVNTPTSNSMSNLDSGSSQQFPNPQGEASIKEPLSPSYKGNVLKTISVSYTHLTLPTILLL